MTVPPKERGAALLSVLLLVAVMATVSATALDRLGIATRLAGNATGYAQARWWMETAELLTAARVEDLLGADSSQTLRGSWLGSERSIALPDGGTVRATVDDGGNCFNLNSLVKAQGEALVPRPIAATQFAALMTLVGIGEADAARIAASAADYIDSDSLGVEQGAANVMMADPSELRAVPGVTQQHYALVKPWLCALPTTDLSPININTLLPEQAPLLAMLDRQKIDLSRARAQIMARPVAGFGSTVDFWKSPAFATAAIADEAAQQVRLRTSFVKLRVTVTTGELELTEEALLDARTAPVRLVHRKWGEGA